MKQLKRFSYLLLDLAVALFAVGAAVALYRFGIMTLLEKLLPLSELQFMILRRAGVMAALFFAYWTVARYYEKRTITELAFKPLAILVSALFGIILIGITILSLYALEHYQLVSFRGYSAALSIMVAIALGVVLEEVVFRGVIFRLLEQHAGTVIALVVQASIFGGLHLFNDGTSAMTVISVTLLGAFWAVIYVYSRNLWVVVANHVAWNLTIFVPGVPLSGQEAWRLSAPFESSYQGPVWLTGGGFGPEDSLINVLVMACALGGLAYWAWRRRSFTAGSWSNSRIASQRTPSVSSDR